MPETIGVPISNLVPLTSTNTLPRRPCPVEIPPNPLLAHIPATALAPSQTSPTRRIQWTPRIDNNRTTPRPRKRQTSFHPSFPTRAEDLRVGRRVHLVHYEGALAFDDGRTADLGALHVGVVRLHCDDEIFLLACTPMKVLYQRTRANKQLYSCVRPSRPVRVTIVHVCVLTNILHTPSYTMRPCALFKQTYNTWAISYHDVVSEIAMPEREPMFMAQSPSAVRITALAELEVRELRDVSNNLPSGHQSLER